MESTTLRSGRSLSIMGLAAASLRHYPRLLWPIALGIAAAAATILGAMFVGDSLRGSLRSMALDRIGRVEQVLLAPNFFSAESLEAPAVAEARGSLDSAVPAVFFPATSLEHREGQELRRASGVLLLGVNKDYWALGELDDPPVLTDDSIAVNEATAAELGIQIGDELSVQLPASAKLSSDSPLGKRESEVVVLANLRLAAILPNRSIGGFSLQSNQQAPLTAFVSIGAVQAVLGRPNQINAALFATPVGSAQSTDQSYDAASKTAQALLSALPLSLTDMALQLDRHTLKGPTPNEETIYDYYQLSSEGLLVNERIVELTRQEFKPEHTAVLFTYLANAIEPVAPKGRSHIVPYSTITGLDPSIVGANQPLWQFHTDASVPALGPDECWINRWLAEDLGVEVGDTLQVAYFESELQAGNEVEHTFTARIAGVVPLTEPRSPHRRNREAVFEDRPTPFNDPALTPSVEGITDQESISDWDTPFPLTRDVRGEDDEYWQNHRLTPKLYLPLERSQKLFGSRFGNATSVRIDPAVASTPQELGTRLTQILRPAASALGWQVIPLRAAQLRAASGTTPFDALFLSLSFFVIAAAMMLVFLLIRLAVESRQSQWGLLLAIGWATQRIRGLILAESLLLIATGCILGLVLGAGFCWSVLELFRGRWGGAVVNASLEFHWSVKSVLIGSAAAGVTALATIWISLRWLSRRSSLSLLRQTSTDPVLQSATGDTPEAAGAGKAPPARSHSGAAAGIAAICTIVGASVLGWFAFELQGPAQAGSFLAAGGIVLIGLTFVFFRLFIAYTPRSAAEGLHFRSLAASSMRRNRVRSLLAVALVAVASFLLVSVSLFHLEPQAGGTGGFEFLATTDLPIARDLNDAAVRRNALGDVGLDVLNATSIVSMRLRAGDDASCNNLYQATQPRVLGVPDYSESGENPGGFERFDWASRSEAVERNGEASKTWDMLHADADGTAKNPLPVILDQNTALWALHLKGAVGEEFAYRYDERDVYFRTVGLLQNTILQGYLIVGESNFTRVFPSISGRRVFLIDTPGPGADTVAATLENGWANEGFDAVESSVILAGLLAVQNTYLRAFQTLGALGLILGTLGLAVIQFRSVMERRGEIGLLQAVGYPPRRVAAVLLTEHSILLAAGTGIGLAGAAVAIALAHLGGQSIGRFLDPVAMLGLVLIVGTFVGLLAIRRSLRLPLLASLRS